jgi:hypothetical protein
MWEVMRAPFCPIGSLAIWTMISCPSQSKSEITGREYLGCSRGATRAVLRHRLVVLWRQCGRFILSTLLRTLAIGAVAVPSHRDESQTGRRGFCLISAEPSGRSSHSRVGFCLFNGIRIG